MASFAYSVQNVFPISPEAEREGLSDLHEAAPDRCGSYINLDEQLDSSQDGDEGPASLKGSSAPADLFAKRSKMYEPWRLRTPRS